MPYLHLHLLFASFSRLKICQLVKTRTYEPGIVPQKKRGEIWTCGSSQKKEKKPPH